MPNYTCDVFYSNGLYREFAQMVNKAAVPCENLPPKFKDFPVVSLESLEEAFGQMDVPVSFVEF